MPDLERFARIEVRSAIELSQWLLDHHQQHDAVWLVTYKKVVPARYVATSEVLDELVAFGWIDGIRRALDEERTMQLISPRRTQPWAKTCKDRAERLTAAGSMHPSGLDSVNCAKESGAWEVMVEVDALIVPDDLRAALEGAHPAWAEFSNFPPSVRRNILRWIAIARSEPTRIKRIALTASEAQEGRRVKSNG
ncbi:uncharacterized protein YdeI (YjbR/CyaY-like superfamily) [Salinibacterium sp. CAN_S4]|uniref:YdeI/OmpD-associated family protein n=1 Tax=Salinibacterium sp. CAN_S4 TaxID=2787727 RepID=UPI0018F048E9